MPAEQGHCTFQRVQPSWEQISLQGKGAKRVSLLVTLSLWRARHLKYGSRRKSKCLGWRERTHFLLSQALCILKQVSCYLTPLSAKVDCEGDRSKLTKWETVWQIRFSVIKCKVKNNKKLNFMYLHWWVMNQQWLTRKGLLWIVQ